MSDIVLKGDELEYWKAHSDLIDALSEWAEDDTLEIKLEWFPKFTEDDFNFLKKFLHKKNIHYTNSKKHGTFIYNIKGYTADRAKSILDYIMYMKPSNVTEIVKRKYKNSGMGSNNGYIISNNNTDYNININEPTKKEKYRSNIRINNNNSVPYGKRRAKTMKKKSKKGITFKKH